MRFAQPLARTNSRQRRGSLRVHTITHAALEPVPHALGPQKDDPAVKEETQNCVSAVGVNPIMKGTWGSWCIGGVSQVRH